MPKLTIAAVLLVLVALAATMSYTGYLVVGVLADLLGTGRVIAGLLLGVLFARFPSTRGGRLHLVGLLPTAARRPLILGILMLCLARFLFDGADVSAIVTAFTATFLVVYPWLKKAVLARVSSSVMQFAAGRNGAVPVDDNVIEGEFRETKG